MKKYITPEFSAVDMTTADVVTISNLGKDGEGIKVKYTDFEEMEWS